jgi:hypothetical protein
MTYHAFLWWKWRNYVKRKRQEIAEYWTGDFSDDE